MALYQYYLAVVPLQGLLQKFDTIPDSIGTSSETGYFESDAPEYWNEVVINADDIAGELDKIISRDLHDSESMISWKSNLQKPDNDALIILNEDQNIISEFSFRADLREEKLSFLRAMIELGKRHHWVFMDRKGRLMKPDIHEIALSIKASDNYKFLLNPQKYLSEFAANKKDDPEGKQAPG